MEKNLHRQLIIFDLGGEDVEKKTFDKLFI